MRLGNKVRPAQNAKTMTDGGSELDLFAAAFQTCTISKSDWTHHAHLKVGLWHIVKFGRDEALTRLRSGIRRLNESHAVPNSDSRGYHETFTCTYVQLIDEFIRNLPESMSIDEAVQHLLSSRLAHKDFLLTFYSRDLLMSRRARLEYVEPDLAPALLHAGGVQ